MITYQDFLESSDKENFIIQSMDNYLASYEYAKLIEADKYYSGDNPTLAKMQAEFKTETGHDIELFAKIPVSSGIFKRLVTLQVNSLWYYGVQLDNGEKKKKLGKNFDKLAKDISTNAAIHKICYGFWNLDHIEMFTAREYLPLPDERTGAHMAGIRFWRIDEDKPWNVQLFEIDGWTEYKRTDGLLVTVENKRPYKINIKRDAVSTTVLSGENYPSFPIIPLYANSQRENILTTPIKSKIDLYDAIMSSFGNSVLTTRSIYWILKNFSGKVEDLIAIKDEIGKLGIIAPNDDSDVDAKTIDLPFNAVMEFLDYLEQSVYKDAMIMNEKEISGGSLTNVAINTAQYSETLNVSDFEWQVSDFVDRLLNLISLQNDSIIFKRKTISNDLEITQRTIMLSPYLDEQTILELDPLIANELIKTILKRKALEDLGANDDTGDEPADGDVNA